MPANIKHLYAHIPFCRSKCPYCDFFSIPHAGDDKKKLYTQALIRELTFLSDSLAAPLETVYFGGGSPLMIGSENLLSVLRTILPKTNNRTEISVELNPDHLEEHEDIFEFGFNRMSIGVQTTDQAILKKIKRKYDLGKLIKNIDKIKKRSKILSLDFMFGLPGQGLKELDEDINFIKDQRPEHLSFYLFTPPSEYEYINDCADDELVEQMFSVLNKSLTGLDYDHYEISNYALGDKACRHNMAYWERRSYLGIGAGAHSLLSNKKQRSWHAKDVDAYIKDPLSYEGMEILDDKMELNEKIMLGLRLLHTGVDKGLLNNKDYSLLMEKGLIVLEDNKIVLTKKGIPLLDHITSELAT
jgi:oxygen-independent coproporphyrinogen III oxidase